MEKRQAGRLPPRLADCEHSLRRIAVHQLALRHEPMGLAAGGLTRAGAGAMPSSATAAQEATRIVMLTGDSETTGPTENT